ncbi:hypothetical protein [Emcibacter sp. SYSU 3D8]|uniref:hypothetical protein n=1 Tax=Emcibacter sp. SYSU 3D8 TaxID=3133969 RepID=UPI0031FE6544
MRDGRQDNVVNLRGAFQWEELVDTVSGQDAKGLVTTDYVERISAAIARRAGVEPARSLQWLLDRIRFVVAGVLLALRDDERAPIESPKATRILLDTLAAASASAADAARAIIESPSAQSALWRELGAEIAAAPDHDPIQEIEAITTSLDVMRRQGHSLSLIAKRAAEAEAERMLSYRLEKIFLAERDFASALLTLIYKVYLDKIPTLSNEETADSREGSYYWFVKSILSHIGLGHLSHATLSKRLRLHIQNLKSGNIQADFIED